MGKAWGSGIDRSPQLFVGFGTGLGVYVFSLSLKSYFDNMHLEFEFLSVILEMKNDAIKSFPSSNNIMCDSENNTWRFKMVGFHSVSK